MKKQLAVTRIESIPDWSTCELPAGVYLNSGTLYFYKGDKSYPLAFYLEWMFENMLSDEAIASTAVAKSDISVEDALRIIIASRANPDNLALEPRSKF